MIITNWPTSITSANTFVFVTNSDTKLISTNTFAFVTNSDTRLCWWILYNFHKYSVLQLTSVNTFSFLPTSVTCVQWAATLHAGPSPTFKNTHLGSYIVLSPAPFLIGTSTYTRISSVFFILQPWPVFGDRLSMCPNIVDMSFIYDTLSSHYAMMKPGQTCIWYSVRCEVWSPSTPYLLYALLSVLWFLDFALQNQICNHRQGAADSELHIYSFFTVFTYVLGNISSNVPTHWHIDMGMMFLQR